MHIAVCIPLSLILYRRTAITNVRSCGWPFSQQTVYDGKTQRILVHNSCNSPTGFSSIPFMLQNKNTVKNTNLGEGKRMEGDVWEI